VIYYELDHLEVGSAGTARFAYRCTVHLLDEGGAPHAAAVYEATREEENVGSHRRQFVTIPVASLPDGSYEVRMVVQDLENGAEVSGSTTFTKGGLGSLAETPR
jgi:hypothetical protein